MAIDPVTLENDHARLEPIAEHHRELLRAAGDDPGLWRFASINQYAADFDAWFDQRRDFMARAGECTFAVYAKRAGAWAGSTSYLAPSLANGRVEIGWTWYAQPFQAGAVNPACKRLLMAHGFETLGLARIELKLDARNTRSWRAVEKLGALHEGVHRHHMLLPDGHRRDTAWFSVLAAEWPEVRAGLDARLAAFAGS